MNVHIIGSNGPKKFKLCEADPGEVVNFVPNKGKQAWLVTDIQKDFDTSEWDNNHSTKWVTCVDLVTGKTEAFGNMQPCYIYEDPEVVLDNFILIEEEIDQK